MIVDENGSKWVIVKDVPTKPIVAPRLRGTEMIKENVFKTFAHPTANKSHPKGEIQDDELFHFDDSKIDYSAEMTTTEEGTTEESSTTESGTTEVIVTVETYTTEDLTTEKTTTPEPQTTTMPEPQTTIYAETTTTSTTAEPTTTATTTTTPYPTTPEPGLSNYTVTPSFLTD